MALFASGFQPEPASLEPHPRAASRESLIKIQP
jgi:hypothetical protein